MPNTNVEDLGHRGHLIIEEAADSDIEILTGVYEFDEVPSSIRTNLTLPSFTKALSVDFETRPLRLNQNHPNEENDESGRKDEIGESILNPSKVMPTEELNGGKGAEDKEA
jgi:hypothetical protein